MEESTFFRRLNTSPKARHQSKGSTLLRKSTMKCDALVHRLIQSLLVFISNVGFANYYWLNRSLNAILINKKIGRTVILQVYQLPKAAWHLWGLPNVQHFITKFLTLTSTVNCLFITIEFISCQQKVCSFAFNSLFRGASFEIQGKVLSTCIL